MIEKLWNLMNDIIKGIIVLCLFAMLVIMNVQVYYRFVINRPLAWPEEAIVILMLWAMYLSAAILLKEKGHISFDYLVERFSFKKKKILDLLINLLMIAFLGLIVYYGFKLSIDISNIKTAALRISRMIPYSAIPISASLMILYIFQNITNILKNKQR